MEMLIFFSKSLPFSHNVVLSLRPQPKKKEPRIFFTIFKHSIFCLLKYFLPLFATFCHFVTFCQFLPLFATFCHLLQLLDTFATFAALAIFGNFLAIFCHFLGGTDTHTLYK